MESGGPKGFLNHLNCRVVHFTRPNLEVVAEEKNINSMTEGLGNIQRKMYFLRRAHNYPLIY